MKHSEVVARRRAIKSGLEMDWQIFKGKRKAFEKENRKCRRSFAKRTEAKLRDAPNSVIAASIDKDRRRLKNLKALKEINP